MINGGREVRMATTKTFVLGVVLAAGMASLAVPAGAAAQEKEKAVAQAEPEKASLKSSMNESLRPGDALKLRIWREDDLSGEFQVDPNGVAILPRLGPVRVTGLPIQALRDSLTLRYQEYLNNPSIEIIPLRRIAVIGAVKTPGVHRVDPSVTLGEAINAAGGPTSDSRRNIVELRRGSKSYRYQLDDDPAFAETPLYSGDQIYVPQRSWLSQNATWFVSTLVGIAGTTAYLVFRR